MYPSPPASNREFIRKKYHFLAVELLLELADIPFLFLGVVATTHSWLSLYGYDILDDMVATYHSHYEIEWIILFNKIKKENKSRE